jgi:4-aminobutyrate aminotransferase
MKLKGPTIKHGPPGPKVVKMLEKAGLTAGDYGSPLVERAEGIYIEDPDGNVFIDMISGRCVANTGHGHPRIAEALQKQIAKGYHWQIPEMHSLVDRLGDMTRLSPAQVYWSQAGSMVNDFAIKASKRITKRPNILSFTGSYHGSTVASASISGYDPVMTRGYSPVMPGVFHAPYGACYRCPLKHDLESCGLACLDYIEDVMFKTYVAPDELAAVFVEPLQGDAGWHVPPEGWHKGLRRICDDNGILLVVDEIQTAFGRTGKWTAMEHWDVKGDIILLGKAMASGIPLSAAVLPRDIIGSTDGDPIPIHAQSFSGTPLGIVAAHATMDVIRDEKLCENAKKTGGYLKQRLEELMESYSCIGDVRGLGLLLGVEIVKDRKSKIADPEMANKICAEAFKRGLFILNMGSYGGKALRIAPPLVITREQVDTAVEVLDESFRTCSP